MLAAILRMVGLLIRVKSKNERVHMRKERGAKISCVFLILGELSGSLKACPPSVRWGWSNRK